MRSDDIIRIKTYQNIVNIWNKDATAAVIPGFTKRINNSAELGIKRIINLHIKKTL